MFRDEDLAYALRLGQAGVPSSSTFTPAPRTNSTSPLSTPPPSGAIADRVLSSTGCPCPAPVAAVQPALINDRRSVLAAQPAPTSDYACDPTHSRCHQEPFVIGDMRRL
jgi:hypothetical protein